VKRQKRQKKRKMSNDIGWRFERARMSRKAGGDVDYTRASDELTKHSLVAAAASSCMTVRKRSLARKRRT